MTTRSRINEAVKICDITGSRTYFYLQERLLWMKALSSAFDWPEAADCDLCHVWVCIRFRSTSLKFMNRRHTSRLFIDFLSRAFIEELTGLVLATFICLHSWK